MAIPVWQPADNDLRRLRGDGGAPFTAFVDALVRAEAALIGVSQLDIATNARTNLGDGGVDTEVLKGLGDDHPGRTIWQYKAADQSCLQEAELRAEIDKPYARKCIEEGAGYRLAICESITAHDKAAAEERLNRLVRAVNPNSPPARVLTISELAAWAGTFPAIVVRFFHHHLGHGALTLEEWRKGQRAHSPKFAKSPITMMHEPRSFDTFGLVKQ